MAVLTVRLVLGFALLVHPGAISAHAPDAEGIKKPQMVVLTTVADEEAGRAAANRAADRLEYAVAPDTLRKPAPRRVYVGEVVTLQRFKPNVFEVVSYMGDEPGAVKALADARKYYPAARMVPAQLPKQATDEPTDVPFYRLGILVLGSYKSYDDAVRAAKWFSARSKYPYGSRGLIYDKERGLIWPDDSDDEAWAGRYAPRRYDDECDMRQSKPCITVERSEAYEGFSPGFYIVVGGVLGRGVDRADRLAAARKIVPGAYVKQTTIYLGCSH